MKTKISKLQDKRQKETNQETKVNVLNQNEKIENNVKYQ